MTNFSNDIPTHALPEVAGLRDGSHASAIDVKCPFCPRHHRHSGYGPRGSDCLPPYKGGSYVVRPPQPGERFQVYEGDPNSYPRTDTEPKESPSEFWARQGYVPEKYSPEFEALWNSARSEEKSPEWTPEETAAYLKELDRSLGPITMDLIDNSALIDVARAFLARNFRQRGKTTLIRHAGSFYVWTGDHYRPESDEDIRAQLYTFIMNCWKRTTRPRVVNEALEVVKAVTNVSSHVCAPAWLNGWDTPADQLIAFSNGLLDLNTDRCSLIPHMPDFYNLNVLPFPYHAAAPEPVEWLKFLHSVWPDDQQSIELLHEWFGLMLTNQTKYNKILLMVGPPRSGKGTIVRVLTMMLGQHNTCSPTLNSLGESFGLQPIIGKLLAVINDARLSARSDNDVMVERLLSLSGDDSVSVNRKNQTAWEGKLNARVMILSNELPSLRDSSGAAASRLLFLRQTISNLGKEDLGLLDRLTPEIPGILRWSLTGLDRLTARGRFVQPASADGLVRQMADIGSPIAAFVRDECQVGADLQVSKSQLFAAWNTYSTNRGFRSGGTASDFGRRLRAALGGTLGERRPNVNGDRTEYYVGLTLCNSNSDKPFSAEPQPNSILNGLIG